MHLNTHCSLFMVILTLGVWSFPQAADHDAVRRADERQEDRGDPQERILDLRMNKVHPSYEDYYMCYSSDELGDQSEYIVQMEALATSKRAHHILIYGCEGSKAPHTSWQCGQICTSGGPKILWAWAKNADPTRVPKNVGFPIGESEGISQLVMQIHYKKAIPTTEEGDDSGVRLTLTKQRLKYHAGIFLFVSWQISIPPSSMGVHADVSCRYDGDTNMYPFAFRVHSHSLGRVISAYHNNGSWYQIGKGNPQWPQAFYNLKEQHMVIRPGEHMAARCTYDAPNLDHTVHVGGQHTDEMCNFYLMYYTDASSKQQLSINCGGNRYPEDFPHLPAGNDVALPPNPALEEQAEDPSAPHVHVHMDDDTHPEETQEQQMETPAVSVNKQTVIEVVGNWPQFKPEDKIELGQVAGVAVDSKNIVHIFHRGPRKWDKSTFDVYSNFKGTDAIDVNTIISIDENGNVLKQWGANLFYMPHGLHIDDADNIWITDVALHQVFKFPAGKTQPSLVLGKRLKPGSDDESFCKPTDVAVLKNGEFFVADGYCNHRILKFDKDGKLLKKWGNATEHVDEKTHFPEPYAFDIPHSITALEDKGWVCVADRENGRIQCFDYEGKLTKEIHPTEFNNRLFAVTYSAANGVLYAVDGNEMFDTGKLVQGFILDPEAGSLVNTFKPSDKGFEQPHDIAVCATGEHVYVAEIGPNKIWKFNIHLDQLNVLLQHRSVKKPGVNLVKRPSSTGTDHDNEAEKQLEDAEDDSQDMGASLVIGCLLIIPVIIIVAATIFVRIRKTANSRRGYTKADVLLDSDTETDSEDDLYEHTLYESPSIQKQVHWSSGDIDSNHVPGNLHSLPFTAVTKTDGSI